MIMVALLELVLDDDRVTRLILGHYVHAEVAGVLLSFGACQLQRDRLGQCVDVLLQPGSEVECLMLPHITQ
jgi:hypothetical protein